MTGEPDILKGKGAAGRGQVEIPVTCPIMLGLASGVAVGEDPGSPVTDEYKPPFAFTGKIHTVTVDVSGDLIIFLKIIMSSEDFQGCSCEEKEIHSTAKPLVATRARIVAQS